MNLQKHVSLNLNLRGLGESPTLAMSERCRVLRTEGKEVLNNSIGQSPFPVPNSVVKALKMYAREKTYLPVKGLPELRNAVADYHRQKDGIDASADNVLIGPGSKILMYLLQMSFYGEIVVPTPCWVSYVPQAQLLGRQVKLINTTYEDRWHLSADSLTELCESEHDTYRPRIVILNYPGNPDGGTYTVEELKNIAKVARKYEVILLSDEIYGELHHRGEHVSIANYYSEGTIISSGISKWCAAGGWRLGTFTFPDNLDWLLAAMSDAASQTYTSVSSPIQWAGVTAFKGSVDIERYLWHARRIFSKLSNQCAEMLREAGARVHDPEGAFYLFPDFTPIADKLEKRGINGSVELCDRILCENHVATIPGAAFSRPENEFTLRMSYCNFDGSKALAASEAIPLHEDLPEGFLDHYCAKTLESTKRICDFVRPRD
ncbi:MAG: aminotransferase class I/II-fold pyridoxal phosphate-dependent enzyme [Thermoplasmata archaeon]|nr:aminotransferase class I/II-fold pyridoxal phosphate-dependent enzyme [Thermoplasmata archaeon]